MHKIFPALILLIFVNACSSPVKEKDKTVSEGQPEGTANDINYDANLEAYRSFVSSLDSTKAETVSLAANKFRELFDEAADEICDRAFVDFSRHYDKVFSSLEREVSNEKIQETPCYDEQGNDLPNKDFKKFLAKVEKHGFRAECWEAFPGVGMDRSFIERHFYGSVSPAMRAYLVQLDIENDDKYYGDASIRISEEELVNRTIFWEKFIAENPDFVMVKDAKANFKEMFEVLIFGLDNTPSIGYDGQGEVYNYESVYELDPYFVKAYNYLNRKYSKSETNKLVAPFFKAAVNQDVGSINKLLNKYKAQGRID